MIIQYGPRPTTGDETTIQKELDELMKDLSMIYHEAYAQLYKSGVVKPAIAQLFDFSREDNKDTLLQRAFVFGQKNCALVSDTSIKELKKALQLSDSDSMLKNLSKVQLHSPIMVLQAVLSSFNMIFKMHKEAMSIDNQLSMITDMLRTAELIGVDLQQGPGVLQVVYIIKKILKTIIEPNYGVKNIEIGTDGKQQATIIDKKILELYNSKRIILENKIEFGDGVDRQYQRFLVPIHTPCPKWNQFVHATDQTQCTHSGTKDMHEQILHKCYVCLGPHPMSICPQFRNCWRPALTPMENTEPLSPVNVQQLRANVRERRRIEANKARDYNNYNRQNNVQRSYQPPAQQTSTYTTQTSSYVPRESGRGGGRSGGGRSRGRGGRGRGGGHYNKNYNGRKNHQKQQNTTQNDPKQEQAQPNASG
jgi:hypothetical protein